MAAPLPTGGVLQALPTAPTVDPTLFAPNALEQLKVAHAGMEIGNELARLGDMKAQLDLERAQRKAEMAATEYKRQQVDHATANLPKIVQAQMAAVAAEQAQNENARAGAAALAAESVPEQSARIAKAQGGLALASATAQADANLPKLKADAEAAQTINATNSASADSSFSKLPAPVRTQALEGAKTLGSWGIKEGDGAVDSTISTPMGLRETSKISEVDPQTGNTIDYSVVIDKRTNQIVSKTPIGTSKLGVDEKSVGTAAREARALIQTKDMARDLKTSLDSYQKAGAGGLFQAMATNAANSAPSGQLSVIKKALGAKFQSKATVGIVSQLQALKNTISNTIYGSALTKEESSNLQGQLPTAEDLTDPERAMLKLEQTIGYLDTKLRPYRESGILEKAKLHDEPTAPPAVAALTKGEPVKYRGLWYRLGMENGKQVLLPYSQK